MRCACCLFLLATVPLAADDQVARGAAVYRASCGVVYCHGPEGNAGRAPRLAGAGLTGAEIVETATRGRPSTAMPAFGGRLKPEEIEAVAAYLIILGGGAQRPGGTTKAPAMPAAAEQGRALFFDAARTGSCGSCHEIRGRGIPVSIALANLRKARLEDFRRVATPDVVTVRPPGEDSFPAVVAEKSATLLRVYDLSSSLPVLRTFAAGEATVTNGASWRHSDAASLYSDSELASILLYLRWAAEQ